MNVNEVAASVIGEMTFDETQMVPTPHEMACTILQLCHECEAGRISKIQLNAVVDNLLFPLRKIVANLG